MDQKSRARTMAGGLVILSTLIFGAGINWGLPSHDIDSYLFGTGDESASAAHNSWVLTGVGITKLTGGFNNSAGLPSDMAAQRITDRSRPITLLENQHQTPNSQDDAARARILSRYRLYSYQPDEMISFRALASMHPGQLQFDPKLYQYGGLWIYPLGAIVKAASFFGLVSVSADPTFYLDSPAEFGKFYIVARAYSAAWGIVAALAVFAILRRATGRLVLPFIAAICFMVMPVVLDLAHEAKPHLAGAAILLLAILAASRYIETGKTKWFIWTAIACGSCAAMVLSGAIAIAILPAMSIVRRDRPSRFFTNCAAGILIAAAVYFAADPYVAVHLLGDRSVLASNLANTRAMYSPAAGSSTAMNAPTLFLAAASLPLGIFGALWLILAIFTKREKSLQRGIGCLIAVPGLIVLVQFVLFAAGKPGEYGRFALIPATALLLTTFLSISKVVRRTIFQAAAGMLILLFVAFHSFAYGRGFLADAGSDTSRIRAAAIIDQHLNDNPAPILYVTAEPAPYCLPPVNLFRWRMVLLPPGGQVPSGATPGLLVKPHQSIGLMDPNSTPISWANMEFDIAQVGTK